MIYSTLSLQYKDGAFISERRQEWLAALPALQDNETGVGMLRRLSDENGALVTTKKRKRGSRSQGAGNSRGRSPNSLAAVTATAAPAGVTPGGLEPTVIHPTVVWPPIMFALSSE